MTISVLIPTYRRVQDLERCLKALQRQTRFPDRVIVTVRDTDAETWEFLKTFVAQPLSLKPVAVTEPGVVAAMNAGLAHAIGEIVALTDDDTAPFPDWIERLEKHFESDARIGGVGGRDYQTANPGEAEVVGLLKWYGGLVGNHHLGVGKTRDVQVLKGANCAFRTVPLKAIGFDTRLAGKGAQVNWELAICLAFLRAGWRLVYDPAVGVHHYIAVRHDNDLNHRGIFGRDGHRDAVHNGTMLLWEHFSPFQKMAFASWMLFLGTKGDPGLVGLMYLLAKRDPHALARYRTTLQGRVDGIMTAWKTQRKEVPGPDAFETTEKKSPTQTVVSRVCGEAQ